MAKLILSKLSLSELKEVIHLQEGKIAPCPPILAGNGSKSMIRFASSTLPRLIT